MAVEYVGPGTPDQYEGMEYIGPEKPEVYSSMASGIKSQLGALYGRAKELATAPGRTLYKGVEQIKKGEYLSGAGNILLSPLQALAAPQEFVLGDPAASIAKSVGVGEGGQDIARVVAEGIGGGALTKLATKIPTIGTRIAAETLGFGKPREIESVIVPAAEGARPLAAAEKTIADTLKSSEVSLADKAALIKNALPSGGPLDLAQSLTEPIFKQPLAKKIQDAAEELFTKAGVERNPKQLISDQITELLAAEKIPLPELNEVLKKNNVTFKELADDLFRPSIKSAAQRLGSLGRLSQRIGAYLDANPGAQKDLDAIVQAGRDLDETIRARSWWQRATGVWRGTLVTQLATSMRNAETQFGRLGLDALENLMDSGLQRIFGTANQSKPSDAIEPIIRFFTRGTKAQVDNILKDLPREHDRLFGTFASDVAAKVGEGAGGPVDKIFTQAEKGVQFLNTFNRWQEFTFRRAIFAAEYSKSGSAEQAVNKALELTFAKNPDYGTAGYHFIKLVNQTPAVLAVPFARFMTNSIKFFYEFSPAGLVKLLKPAERAAVAGGDFKTISRATLGTGLLGTAWQLRNSEYAGEKWYEAKIAGETVDLRPFNPFAPYLFVADTVKRAQEGTLGKLSTKDWAEAMLSLNLRGGTGLAILDNLFGQWKGGDPERWKTQAAQVGGQLIGGFATPLQTVKDVLAGFSSTPIRDVKEEPVLGPLKSRVPGLEATLPQAYSPTQEAPLQREMPIVRQLTGVSVIQKKNPAQQALDRLGFKQEDVFLSTGDPKADRDLKQTTGLLVERVLSPMVEKPEFQNQPPTLQALMMEKVISRIKSNALKATMAKYPDVAIRAKLGKIPNRLKLYLEKEGGLDVYELAK